MSRFWRVYGVMFCGVCAFVRVITTSPGVIQSSGKNGFRRRAAHAACLPQKEDEPLKATESMARADEISAHAHVSYNAAVKLLQNKEGVNTQECNAVLAEAMVAKMVYFGHVCIRRYCKESCQFP